MRPLAHYTGFQVITKQSATRWNGKARRERSANLEEVVAPVGPAAWPQPLQGWKAAYLFYPAFLPSFGFILFIYFELEKRVDNHLEP
jgi:hypothetical protein